MKILQDIKTAVKVFVEVRKARKGGASGVQVKPVYSVPVINPGPAWYNTMEVCLTHRLGRETDQAVRDVFKSFSRETQHRLEFTPETPQEWVARARFWERELESVLPREMYHKVMLLYIRWYLRCLRQRKAKEAQL